jgi:hypothetical protein
MDSDKHDAKGKNSSTRLNTQLHTNNAATRITTTPMTQTVEREQQSMRRATRLDHQEYCYRGSEHFPSRPGSRASTRRPSTHHQGKAHVLPQHNTKIEQPLQATYQPSPKLDHQSCISKRRLHGGDDARAPLPPKPKLWVLTRDKHVRGRGGIPQRHLE